MASPSGPETGVRLIVDLVPGSDPIAGRVASDGMEREFSGYMGLIATLLEALRSADTDGDDRRDLPL